MCQYIFVIGTSGKMRSGFVNTASGLHNINETDYEKKKLNT